MSDFDEIQYFCFAFDPEQENIQKSYWNFEYLNRKKSVRNRSFLNIVQIWLILVFFLCFDPEHKYVWRSGLRSMNTFSYFFLISDHKTIIKKSTWRWSIWLGSISLIWNQWFTKLNYKHFISSCWKIWINTAGGQHLD